MINEKRQQITGAIYKLLRAALVGHKNDLDVMREAGEQKTDGVEMGSLISARQLERVAGFVDRAQAQKHMEVTTGGSD